MKHTFNKSIFFLIHILIFLISQTKSSEGFLRKATSTIKRDDDDDDDDDPTDMNTILEHLKKDIQKISKDISKYDILIDILIPLGGILFLILLFVSIYEIIKCCYKRKRELRVEQNNSSFIYTDINNITKCIYTPYDSSSVRESLNEKVNNNSLDTPEFVENKTNNIEEKNDYLAPSVNEINKTQLDKSEEMKTEKDKDNK